MYETRAYDDEHGDPVVILVAEGTHDISRIVHLLNRGRVEHAKLAEQVTRQVRSRRGGRAALRLLAEHGGPDLLTPVGQTAPLFDVTTEVPDLRNAQHVTAAQLAKAYAVSAHRNWIRMLESPFPAEATAEERRQWDNLLQTISIQYGMVLAFRALIAHVPGVADDAAAELWEDWNLGQPVGTTLWEWLSEWGVDPDELADEIKMQVRKEAAARRAATDSSPSPLGKPENDSSEEPKANA